MLICVVSPLGRLFYIKHNLCNDKSGIIYTNREREHRAGNTTTNFKNELLWNKMIIQEYNCLKGNNARAGGRGGGEKRVKNVLIE